MKKRGRRSKSKVKDLEETPTKNLTVKDSDLAKSNLSEIIAGAVKDLYYISETDAEIQNFSGQKAETVSKEELLKQLKLPDKTSVEEKSFAEFFQRLTEKQDWFGEEESKTAEKFATLKELLEQNLTDVKVFKVGKTQIDIYVVGLDSNGFLAGIETKAVET